MELTADIFGPVASFEINHRAHDRPIFNVRTEFHWPHGVTSGLATLRPQDFTVCGLGVDNFSRDLTVSASDLGQTADLELTTGPAQTEFEDDQHEFASHTTFQKQQKCNSPVIAGVLGPPLENRHENLLVRVPPLHTFFVHAAPCLKTARVLHFQQTALFEMGRRGEILPFLGPTPDFGPWF